MMLQGPWPARQQPPRRSCRPPLAPGGCIMRKLIQAAFRPPLVLVVLSVSFLLLAAGAAFFLLRSTLPPIPSVGKAPVIVEVTAALPGTAPEEVEQQVTIPLEV